MHNKWCFAQPGLNDAGLITLRIISRVGQSTGEHDEGRGELDDVRSALEYLEEKYRRLDVTLCGFSFGARVGVEVDLRRARVNLISTALLWTNTISVSCKLVENRSGCAR